MKTSTYRNILIGLSLVSACFYFASCEDAEYPDANPDAGGTPANLSANFLFVNAAPGASSLDLFINNVKSGSSLDFGAGQSSYVNQRLASNGGLVGGNNGNLAIRVKAATGSIGGTLGSADAVFRVANNNNNNLLAVDSAYYTVVVLDSTTRTRPTRKLDEKGFGDSTFVVKTTGEQIGVIEWRALAPLVADRNKKVDLIGTVPLGSTDPGGPRFLVITDQLPLPSTTRFPKPVAGKCAVRFVMASPNTGAPFTGTVTLSVGVTSVTQGLTTNQMTVAGGLNPSVGSRAVSNNAYETINAPGAQNIVARQGTTELARIDNFNFQDRGVYTIVLSGNRRSAPAMSLAVIKNR